MKYLYSFVIVVFLFASCKTAKQDATSKAGNISSIRVERTPCFGFCPIYEVQINADGTATLDARDHLPNKLKGKFIGKVAQTDWDKLVKLLHTLDYQNLQEAYGNHNVSDLPSVNMAIRYGKEQEKKVNDYGGRGTPELTQFYERIDKLVNDAKWDIAK